MCKFPSRLFRPRTRWTGAGKEASSAFTLVEVVIALGILSFSITALLGALSIGMNTNRESIEELEATHILQSMLTERRARPVQEDSNLCLPPLDVSACRDSGNPVILDSMGRPASGAQTGKFGLVYRVTPNPDKSGADVFCAIYWPGQLKPANSLGRVEIATKIVLP